jgi:hypothetical protein
VYTPLVETVLYAVIVPVDDELAGSVYTSSSEAATRLVIVVCDQPGIANNNKQIVRYFMVCASSPVMPENEFVMSRLDYAVEL